MRHERCLRSQLDVLADHAGDDSYTVYKHVMLTEPPVVEQRHFTVDTIQLFDFMRLSLVLDPINKTFEGFRTKSTRPDFVVNCI